jgi:hypothetical protein
MSEGGPKCDIDMVAMTDSLQSVKGLQVALGRRTTKPEQTTGWEGGCSSQTNRNQGTEIYPRTD